MIHTTIFISFLLCCSFFKKNEQHNRNEWSYVHYSTLNDLLKESPDTTYQMNNFLLKIIKRRNHFLQIDSSGNRTEHKFESVYSHELINTETDSIYTFKINNKDTVLSNRKLYLSEESHLGFDVLQFRNIHNKIYSNGFIMESKKDKVQNLYTIKLSNDTHKMTLQIDCKIKSPFNVSIKNENNDQISGALIELQNNSSGNGTFKQNFKYIPHVPKEKKHLFKRLIDISLASNNSLREN
ncbi:MAG: hypothetical protein ACTJHT_04690 [Sphingobacterium sp.]|uniref:hypothetical protein n=1 Tax=Sphingobacterium sp. JB170 TaxID=1434842 RepID=UPI00117A2CA9|nr:hypothetical protein [Sphingobacterium sp. JB170]